MAKIKYVPHEFTAASQRIIESANTIIAEYTALGYDLTLRQLYYQFVSRDLISNTPRSYDRLGQIINDARLAGLIDWHAIVDRTRSLHRLPTWTGPDEIIRACSDQFRIDKWDTQPKHVEVWIEKEALAGVFLRVCDEHRVPFFACRGYNSQSEMWSAAMRLRSILNTGKEVIILHFGDHDPSGLDMTRDLRERLVIFGCEVDFKRIALNMPQVEHYSPPANPAKVTDSRFADYQLEFGDESWELDALPPNVLAELVKDEIDRVIAPKQWNDATSREELGRQILGEQVQKCKAAMKEYGWKE